MTKLKFVLENSFLTFYMYRFGLILVILQTFNLIYQREIRTMSNLTVNRTSLVTESIQCLWYRTFLFVYLNYGLNFEYNLTLPKLRLC